jgi:hypothetical protein
MVDRIYVTERSTFMVDRIYVTERSTFMVDRIHVTERSTFMVDRNYVTERSTFMVDRHDQTDYSSRKIATVDHEGRPLRERSFVEEIRDRDRQVAGVESSSTLPESRSSTAFTSRLASADLAT